MVRAWRARRARACHGPARAGIGGAGPQHYRADYYETPTADDAIGRDYDEAGFINVDWLAANTPTAAATYYLCGSRPFLRAYVSGLARCGVPLHRIRYAG